MNTTTSALLASLLLTSLAVRAGEKEETVTLDQLPTAAAKALRDRAGEAKITKLSKETEDGETRYEGQFKAKGRVNEISVNASGKIVEEESTVTIAEVPKAARKTIEDRAAGGKIEKLERVKKGKSVGFEALISAKGKREEIVVAPDGKIVEREDKTGEKKKD